MSLNIACRLLVWRGRDDGNASSSWNGLRVLKENLGDFSRDVVEALVLKKWKLLFRWLSGFGGEECKWNGRCPDKAHSMAFVSDSPSKASGREHKLKYKTFFLFFCLKIGNGKYKTLKLRPNGISFFLV